MDGPYLVGVGYGSEVPCRNEQRRDTVDTYSMQTTSN